MMRSYSEDIRERALARAAGEDREPIITGTPNAQTVPKKTRRLIGRGHQGMTDAISANRMEPVIDKTIAFALMESGAHFGKVAIAIG